MLIQYSKFENLSLKQKLMYYFIFYDFLRYVSISNIKTGFAQELLNQNVTWCLLCKPFFKKMLIRITEFRTFLRNIKCQKLSGQISKWLLQFSTLCSSMNTALIKNLFEPNTTSASCRNKILMGRPNGNFFKALFIVLVTILFSFLLPVYLSFFLPSAASSWMKRN